MGTRIDTLKRRMTVLTYIQHGRTQPEIATSLGVSERTIRSDLFKVRHKIAEKLQKEVGWDKIVEYTEAQRLRIRRLWFIISDKNSKKRDVLEAIKLLQNEEDKSIRRDQISGILPKEISPLVSIESSSEPGSKTENKVQINIIAPEGKIRENPETLKSKELNNIDSE